jgi:hypothetical protein
VAIPVSSNSRILVGIGLSRVFRLQSPGRFLKP